MQGKASDKYPDVGCKRGYFVDTASTRVPRGRICLFSGYGTPTEPDRTMSAFLVAVADSVDELRLTHPEAFHPRLGGVDHTTHVARRDDPRRGLYPDLSQYRAECSCGWTGR